MNFDIKKDSIIQLIKKTIEANITCCEYLMKNYKIDDIIVKRKNKIIELKKVSSDIFIEDYGQDVGPIKIQFLPNNSLTLKINNNITLTVQQFITDFKKEQEFKKFDVKFFGISVSKKYEIIGDSVSGFLPVLSSFYLHGRPGRKMVQTPQFRSRKR